MKNQTLTLQLSELKLAICRLDPEEVVPSWLGEKDFVSITRTPDELSIVCREDLVPGEIEAERHWRMFRVKGPLEFSLTGILASLVMPLSEAGIAIFAISTYETDYLLVKADMINRALKILQRTCIIENREEE